MGHAFVEGVLIVVHGTEAPTDEQWDGMIEDLRREGTKLDKVFVITEGGGPNARQRSKLGTELPSQDYRSAIVTNARAARLIATAVGWFGIKIKAFSLQEYERGLDYLGITGAATKEAVLRGVADCKLALAGGGRSLDDVQRAMGLPRLQATTYVVKEPLQSLRGKMRAVGGY